MTLYLLGPPLQSLTARPNESKGKRCPIRVGIVRATCRRQWKSHLSPIQHLMSFATYICLAVVNERVIS